jgi:hypothetical protein
MCRFRGNRTVQSFLPVERGMRPSPLPVANSGGRLVKEAPSARITVTVHSTLGLRLTSLRTRFFFRSSRRGETTTLGWRSLSRLARPCPPRCSIERAYCCAVRQRLDNDARNNWGLGRDPTPPQPETPPSPPPSRPSRRPGSSPSRRSAPSANFASSAST